MPGPTTAVRTFSSKTSRQGLRSHSGPRFWWEGSTPDCAVSAFKGSVSLCLSFRKVGSVGKRGRVVWGEIRWQCMGALQNDDVLRASAARNLGRRVLPELALLRSRSPETATLVVHYG